jgi:hypothetical protein
MVVTVFALQYSRIKCIQFCINHAYGSRRIACLFAFSNRSDNVVFKIVFTVLRQALATPRVFMSDMAENFYIALSDVIVQSIET